MSTVKVSKLSAAFEKHKGTEKTLSIKGKGMTITVTGEIHKMDDQYYFSRGPGRDGRVQVETRKTGSILSWKGTYRQRVVKFIVGNVTLAEFEIPENAKLSLDDTDVSEEA